MPKEYTSAVIQDDSRPGIFWDVRCEQRRRKPNREGSLAALRHHAPVDVVWARVAHRPGGLHTSLACKMFTSEATLLMTNTAQQTAFDERRREKVRNTYEG